jgi:hypothetical protein
MPAVCLKRNSEMNFKYTFSFKTFLSETVKCHKTQRRDGERLKKERGLGCKDQQKKSESLTERLKTK